MVTHLTLSLLISKIKLAMLTSQGCAFSCAPEGTLVTHYLDPTSSHSDVHTSVVTHMSLLWNPLSLTLPPESLRCEKLSQFFPFESKSKNHPFPQMCLLLSVPSLCGDPRALPLQTQKWSVLGWGPVRLGSAAGGGGEWGERWPQPAQDEISSAGVSSQA